MIGFGPSRSCRCDDDRRRGRAQTRHGVLREPCRPEPGRERPDEVRPAVEEHVAVGDGIGQSRPAEDHVAERPLVDAHDEVDLAPGVVVAELGLRPVDHEPVDLGVGEELEADRDRSSGEAVRPEDRVDGGHEVGGIAVLLPELDPVLGPDAQLVEDRLELAPRRGRVVLPTPPLAVGASLDDAGVLERPEPRREEALADPPDAVLDLAEVVAVEEDDLAQDQRRPALGDDLAGQGDRTHLLVLHRREYAPLVARARCRNCTSNSRSRTGEDRAVAGVSPHEGAEGAPRATGVGTVNALVRGLTWPVVSLLIIGGSHLLAEMARPSLQAVITPAVVMPSYLAVGAWGGYASARAGGNILVGLVGGAILGLLPAVLPLVGFGIILGRPSDVVATSAAFGFFAMFWGGAIGGGVAAAQTSAAPAQASVERNRNTGTAAA